MTAGSRKWSVSSRERDLESLHSFRRKAFAMLEWLPKPLWCWACSKRTIIMQLWSKSKSKDLKTNVLFCKAFLTSNHLPKPTFRELWLASTPKSTTAVRLWLPSNSNQSRTTSKSNQTGRTTENRTRKTILCTSWCKESSQPCSAWKSKTRPKTQSFSRTNRTSLSSMSSTSMAPSELNSTSTKARKSKMEIFKEERATGQFCVRINLSISLRNHRCWGETQTKGTKWS